MRAVRLLQACDGEVARQLNALARSSAGCRAVVARAATWLAGIEVMLMGALFITGRRGAALRMLAAVTLVYAGSEALGLLWRRERPFSTLSEVEALVAHTAGRSFPSRHVASGLAMATIAHPVLGRVMSIAAWLLGLSRVAAGLHYPSDVLAGAVLGSAVGRVLKPADTPGRRRRG